MNEKILVPALGESITEATVAKWLKSEGDNVEADEPIVELETDKVNLEVPSPIKGVLTEIVSKDGVTVEVGALLGSISQNGSQTIEKKEAQEIDKEQKSNVVNLEIEKKEPKIFDEKKILKDEPLVLIEEPLVLTNEVEVKKESNNLKVKNNETLSPAVRKIVVENKIDLEKVRGTGKDGRVLKGDLIA